MRDNLLTNQLPQADRWLRESSLPAPNLNTLFIEGYGHLRNKLYQSRRQGLVDDDWVDAKIKKNCGAT